MITVESVTRTAGIDLALAPVADDLSVAALARQINLSDGQSTRLQGRGGSHRR